MTSNTNLYLFNISDLFASTAIYVDGQAEVPACEMMIMMMMMMMQTSCVIVNINIMLVSLPPPTETQI